MQRRPKAAARANRGVTVESSAPVDGRVSARGGAMIDGVTGDGVSVESGPGRWASGGLSGDRSAAALEGRRLGRELRGEQL